MGMLVGGLAMKGLAGLLENFAYYYERIVERQASHSLTPFQRNCIYEYYRMAEAFYESAMRESSLSNAQRIDLQTRFEILNDRIRRVQQGAGDIDLRAV